MPSTATDDPAKPVASPVVWSDLDRPPLRVAELRRGLLHPHGPYAALDVVPTVGSTNTELAAAARAGAADRTVLVAEHQTAGRGRGARSWAAPPRSGLALSVLLRPVEVAQARWGWLPLLAGTALCAVVRRLGEIEAALKWPNDLLVGPHRRKCAGILAEVVTGPAVVLGIGLNVTLRADELPCADATSLACEQAACTDRDPLLRALLGELDVIERHWREHRGDPEASGLAAGYRAMCATLGAPVTVALPGREPLRGTAVDVDREGRLMVVDEGGARHAVSAGEVTHLRAG